MIMSMSAAGGCGMQNLSTKKEVAEDGEQRLRRVVGGRAGSSDWTSR